MTIWQQCVSASLRHGHVMAILVGRGQCCLRMGWAGLGDEWSMPANANVGDGLEVGGWSGWALVGTGDRVGSTVLPPRVPRRSR